MTPKKLFLGFLMLSVQMLLLTSCDTQKLTEHQIDSFMLVEQKGGPTLGYSATSGVKLLYIDEYAFKDLNRNDSLDRYEDWRPRFATVGGRDCRPDAI